MSNTKLNLNLLRIKFNIFYLVQTWHFALNKLNCNLTNILPVLFSYYWVYLRWFCWIILKYQQTEWLKISNNRNKLVPEVHYRQKKVIQLLLKKRIHIKFFAILIKEINNIICVETGTFTATRLFCSHYIRMF